MPWMMIFWALLGTIGEVGLEHCAIGEVAHVAVHNYSNLWTTGQRVGVGLGPHRCNAELSSNCGNLYA
jgi:hypothetical protein